MDARSKPSRLMRGILGGLYGGLNAHGKNIASEKQAAIDKAKEEALLKRQITLAKFQDDLARARTTDQNKYQEGLLDKQIAREDVLRGESRDYAEKQKLSGQWFRGKELTYSELEKLSDEDKKELLSTEAVKQATTAEKQAWEKEKLTHEYGLKGGLLFKKGSTKDDKDAEKNAMYDVGAYLSGKKGYLLDPANNKRKFSVPVTSQEEIDTIKRNIKSAGFNVTTVTNKDKKGNIEEVEVNLGSFSLDRRGSISEEVKTTSPIDKYLSSVPTTDGLLTPSHKPNDVNAITVPINHTGGISAPVDSGVPNQLLSGRQTKQDEPDKSIRNILNPKRLSTDSQFPGNVTRLEKEPKAIMRIENKLVAKTAQGYLIYENNVWRKPTREEQQKILMQIRK